LFKTWLKKCFKPILNTNKTALNRLKSLLCSVLLRSTTGHAHCAVILQCKLRNYRNLDFLLFFRVISSGIIRCDQLKNKSSRRVTYGNSCYSIGSKANSIYFLNDRSVVVYLTNSCANWVFFWYSWTFKTRMKRAF
jgi:hypothetical protein